MVTPASPSPPSAPPVLLPDPLPDDDPLALEPLPDDDEAPELLEPLPLEPLEPLPEDEDALPLEGVPPSPGPPPLLEFPQPTDEPSTIAITETRGIIDAPLVGVYRLRGGPRLVTGGRTSHSS